MEFGAYDRNPMYGGQVIGRGVCTVDPVREPVSAMPDSDYERQGFAWLYAHPETIPKTDRAQSWYPCTRAKFDEWRATGQVLYVVRYRILEVTAAATARLERLLDQGVAAVRAKEAVPNLFEGPTPAR